MASNAEKRTSIFARIAILSLMLGLVLTGTAAGDDGGLSMLRSLESSFNTVSEQVLPSVVEINVVQVVRQNVPRYFSPWDFFFGNPAEPNEREFRRPGLGSGVIVRRDGDTVYVISNNHVVGEADEISIRLNDGREFEGRIVGKDERTDLALVSFETGETVPVARLGDSDDLKVGDWVLAIGNPYGFESTVTAGIVSALRRNPEPGYGVAAFTDYIQTDAAINPGNSGGALVNLDGEVIGINTWIASQSGGNVGLGFAIPINNAARAIDEFIERGGISYGWLGVTIVDPTDETMPGVAADLDVAAEDGSLVTNVHVGSPADRYGVQPGDFITAVAGAEVSNRQELSRVVGMQPAGTEVRIDMIRDGRRTAVDVVLKERDEDQLDDNALWPGLLVVGLTDEIRENLDLPFYRRGVIVADIVREAPAAEAGLRSGDLITAVDGNRVRSVRDFYRHLNGAGARAELTVERRGEKRTVDLVKR